jgi:hypothetical protein
MALELALIRPLASGVARNFDPTTDTLEFALADYAGNIGVGGTSCTLLTLGRSGAPTTLNASTCTIGASTITSTITTTATLNAVTYDVNLTTLDVDATSIQLDATANSNFTTTFSAGITATLAALYVTGIQGGWNLAATGSHASALIGISIAAGNSGAGPGGVSIQAKSAIEVGTSSGGAGYDGHVYIGISHTSTSRQVYIGELTSSDTQIRGNTTSVSATTTASLSGGSNGISVPASGTLTITGASGITMTAATGNLIGSGQNVSFTAAATYDLTLTATNDTSSDIFFVAHAASTAYNSIASPSLVGYTATSIIGALNEVKALTHNVEVATVSSATYTLTSSTVTYILVYYSTTNTCTVTLNTAQCSLGRIVTIKDAGLNASVYNITIETQGSETIEGESNAQITGDGDALTFISDGSNWFIV